MELKRAISRDQAAAAMGISPHTLRLDRRGVYPEPFKSGKRVLYRAADVNAWIDSGGTVRHANG